MSSPLPLCDGVVVLDERPPVKGDGLGLSGRLLVNGCGGRRERGGGDSEDVITATNQTEGYFGDRSCGRMEQGHGRERCSFFLFLFLFN